MSTDLLRAIEELQEPSVLVVGDPILDRYVSGTVDRISPEAPIQVLRHDREYECLGGMTAVAANLARLGARVRLAGLVGDDAEAGRLRELLRAARIPDEGLVAEAGRPTTLKTRFVAASQHARQQILRVDREARGAGGAEALASLMDAVRAALADVDVMVLSDYDKGTLARCGAMIEAARHAGVKTIVDPKGKDFARYRGASAITPNRAEAGAATGRTIAGPADAKAAARELLERLDLETVFVTLDRDGIFVLERGGDGAAIRTDPREVYDVTGAGDNVIAVLGYCLAGGLSPMTAAFLANVAGGIAVEHFGVVTVGWDEIAARIAAGTGGEAKLVDQALLQRLLDGARRAGRKIVFTNGCFDVLHAGHVDLLRQARAFGDLLVVGVNDDASVRRLKGAGRPVNPLPARAAVLGGLASVDYVVAFGEDTPAEVLERVRPDVLVKGEDWKDKGVVGRELVEGYGGRVELVPLLDGYSTTETLRKLREE
ncbi:MAG TPA: D-glycero-beta-D-manno-heptose 1-phosphate adenylyltransferase [Planctomycetota bacterium]|nr:D-glycero-beta-D-manno-heptose 1-phosphate adenylyltransferase [Planctomycetota bacterium]